MSSNNLNFTALQLSTNSPYKNYIEAAALVKVVNGEIQDKLLLPVEWESFPDKSSSFGNQWNKVIGFIENNVIACFDAKRTARDLYNLLFGYDIDFSKITIIDGKNLIVKSGWSESTPITYKDVADHYGFDRINIFNAEHKAEFTIKLVLKLSEYIEVTPIEPFFTITAKREKINAVKFSFEELLNRPKEKRFENTYIAFTGTLKTDTKPQVKREDARKIIEQLGGKTTDGIDKQVTHLITGTQRGIPASNKEIKADKEGIIVLTATDFFELIESD
jgi:NAD-dependent DNA ligase